jgi:two-component system alkaline phosphatase synthesis response regulator PhoP
MNDYAIAETAKAAHETLSPKTSRFHRILVVDDEASIRNLHSEALLDAGYHVDSAEDGAIAWDTLQTNNYDLLITDNQMPKVSGLELINMVYAAGMNLRVIMASGTLLLKAFARQPRLQLDAVLLKPHTIAELLRTVKAVLGSQAPRVVV